MPYFTVRIDRAQSKEFIIEAPDQATAEERGFAAEADAKVDAKKAVKIYDTSTSSVSTTETTKATLTEALKNQKVK
jgi:hypothetical protein